MRKEEKTLSPVFFILARLMGLGGLLLLLPLLTAFLLGDPGYREVLGYVVPALLCFGIYLWPRFLYTGERPQLTRPIQGFLCVVVGWLLFALIGSLPYWISGAHPNYVNAFFESMSGFTTTGATAFESVEDLPRGLHLWRSMTEFVGGLGIIALFVAVLPALGAGGVVLLRSEVTAKVLEDRLRPRIMDTAKVLWYIYFGLFFLEFILLIPAGMPPFDALCHSLTTVSTGGFSTKDHSIAAFPVAAQWVVIAFMFLGGTSFLLHGKALTRNFFVYFKNEEFRSYLGSLLLGTGLILLLIMATTPDYLGREPTSLLDPAGRGTDFMTSLRDATFQVTSIMTGTGFSTVDYTIWVDSAVFLIVLLMFVGGCSGSTTGSVKVFRYQLVWRSIVRHIAMLLTPSRVVTVRMNGATVPSEALSAATMMLLCFFLLAAVGALLLMLIGVPFEEAASGAVACLGNVGPALGDLGPAGHYADIPEIGKLILCILMLFGRLEVFSVLVLIASFRRR